MTYLDNLPRSNGGPHPPSVQSAQLTASGCRPTVRA